MPSCAWVLLWLMIAGTAAAQDATPDAAAPAVPDKRIFGVLPNYRTAEASATIEPLTPRQKFTIASKDSFDWPGFAVAAGFSALYQLENQNPSFGQGLQGYAKRYATAYGDQMIGNMFTEGLLPSVLHEDPRYFRLGPSGGTKRHRAKYAATRIFVTRTDSGHARFNFSEVVGNATAVAISNAYYPDTRDVSDNLQKLSIQLATDMFSNIMKEFWPDIKRRLHRAGSSN